MSGSIMTFEEAAEYLDSLADALPEGLTRELNGGINLLPSEKPSETGGLSVLGMYYSGGQMGRYVELYYGSFVKLYGDRPRSVFERELKKTLYHELTHHIESLAGDRSLELEDERFLEEYKALQSGEPLCADSVLFVSAEDFSMAAVACGIFRAMCAEAGEELRSGAALFSETDTTGALEPAAVKAAAKYGADISKTEPERLTKELASSFDAIFCMTEDEADALADEYPTLDARIFALGERDVASPRSASGYAKCARRIADGVAMLVDELFAEDDE